MQITPEQRAMFEESLAACETEMAQVRAALAQLDRKLAVLVAQQAAFRLLLAESQAQPGIAVSE